ncbi:MAG: hypothetical protein ABS87_02960 [Sphingomonas sp. SCN 67-18]|nr:TonB-dependent receptor [Sphingomonas sp. SCN 67-18]ODU22320.1 MAG: hypothetical protein ABS87_02960 [Sphingomonas sp. SCN 67-18]
MIDNRRTRHRQRIAMAAATSLLAWAAPGMAQAQSAPAQSTPTQQAADPGEIVVTATRRDERIEDVPFNIQAISGDDLAAQGVERMVDFLRTVPGASFIDGGANSGSDLVLRGLRTGGNQTSRTTAIYVDDVEIPNDLDLSVIDIERVEVLRGPQGTLYGSGAIGGTLRYITRRPQLDRFEGSAEAGIATTRGGDESWKAAGMVNLPLATDKAALRVNLGYFDNGGFVDNIQTGRKDVDWDRTFSARAALLLKPTETLDITATYYGQFLKTGSRNLVGEDLGRFAVSEAFEGRYVRNQHIGNLTVSLDLGRAQLTSSTSNRWFNGHTRRDSTTYIRDVIFGSFLDPADLPEFNITSATRDKSKHFTQEVRLVSKGDSPFSFVLGGYYNRERTHLNLQETITLPFAGQSDFEDNILGFALTDPAEYLSVSSAGARQWALFGELGYRITPQWQFSVGLRYFDYSSFSDDYNIDQFFGEDARDESGTARTAPLPDEVSNGRSADKGTVLRFNTSYNLTDDALLYATVAQGYRPGGYNSVGANTGITPDQFQYKPDTIWSYELGAKASLLDRRLYVSGAAYYIDWKDIQTQVQTSLGFPLSGNAGKASSKGFELEISSRNLIAPGLSLGLGYGFTDTKLEESIDFLGQKGQQVPFVPRHAGSLTLDYERAVGGDLKFGFNGVLTYTGRSYADFGPDVPDPDEESGLRANDNYLRMRSYMFGTAGIRLGTDRWTVRLDVDNLFDTYADIGRFFNATNSPYRDPYVSRFTMRPRTFWLSGSVRF